MSQNSGAGASLLKSLYKKREAGPRTSDDLLEQHLEMLFSDVAPLPPTPLSHQHDENDQRDTSRPVMPSHFVEESDPSQLLPAKKTGSRSISRGFITSLSTFTILVLLCALVLIKTGWIAQPNLLSLSTGARVAAAALADVSSSTNNARIGIQDTPLPTPVVVQQTATASRDHSATNETVRVVPSATTSPRSSPTPYPTRAIATNARFTPNNEHPTATTDTAVSVMDTPTATSLTPTLAPIRRVLSPTATPVPAYSIGLEAIPTPVPRIPMPENAINMVLLGSDQRPNETYWRTDVIIVVSVNPDLPSVSLLSIPRDTWLYIPNWNYQRINMADTRGAQVGYPGGGPGLVKATIEYNFGIHVDYFARVDFAGLMKIVDTLGGIDVLLDCPVEDGFPDDPITEDPSIVTQISYTEPGKYHLDGKHALWLARSRKTTSEFARSRRQHRILQGIWDKANELGFIRRLPDLWEDMTTTVQTDLGQNDVLWLASIGLQLEPSQIQSGFIDGRYLSAWVTPGGANVLLPHTDAILEILEIHFNPYPYKAPQGFSQVEVWNGSGHKDWGLLAADKLLRHGFEVTEIRQIDQLYEDSSIYDFTTSTKGSPLPLLERLFDANVSHVSIEPDPGRSDGIRVPYRLIVGADYQPCERPAGAQWAPTPTPPSPESGG